MKKRILLAVAVVGILGIAAALWFRPDREAAGPATRSSRAGSTADEPNEQAAPAHQAAAPGRKSRRITRKEFESLRALMEAARRQREAAPAPAPQAAAPPASGGVQDYPRGQSQNVRQYLADQIEELRPLLEECYQLANRETPGLQGDLAVMFTLEGEPEVGGIITESDVIEGGLSSSQRLSECVRESMYAIRLEPPEKGMKIVINKTFSFAPGAEPAVEGQESRKQNPTKNN